VPLPSTFASLKRSIIAARPLFAHSLTSMDGVLFASLSMLEVEVPRETFNYLVHIND
jgi:hypothetical protein